MCQPERKTSTATKVTNGVLLTTADRQIEAFISGATSKKTMTDSLYEAVLFHQGVVLPDIFAFISTAISQQSYSSPRTNLEHVLESGLATPAFRAETDSFESALTRIQEQEILGITENARATAKRLDIARQSSREELRHIPWGSSISTTYGDCFVNALIEVIGEPFHTSGVGKDLEFTREFLIRCGLFDIVKEQIAKTGGDLRRGFILQTILDILNTIKYSGKTKFTSAIDILHHPACANNAAVAAAVKNVVCLANLIYHRNMANNFSANCYLSARAYPKTVHDIASIAIDKSCASIDSNTGVTAKPIDEQVTFRVFMPSMRHLEAVGMKRLLEIRTAHTTGYFSNLESWQMGEGTAEDVQRSLNEYGRELVLAVNSEASFVDVALSRFAKSETAGVQSAARLAIDVLSTDNPLIKSFSAGLGPIANVTYSWITKRPAKVTHSRRSNIVV